ncbi:MAG: sugar transferase [Candidatus Promineifilaceae bacterium]|nr:sugar transferase [Candidatus Promineifilaceae bacterium]
MIRSAVVWLLALFLVILLAPLILLISLLIRLDSRGPLFYTPLMIGFRGRPFHLYRFRTMHNDQPTGTPTRERLTTVGRFIRRYSLDHLPALLNLLNNSLTLIGPRPMEPDLVDMSDPAWQRYFSAKPGLINYAVIRLGKNWSVNHYTNPNVNRDLEVEYIRRKSLSFDLRLLMQFVVGLIQSKGNIKSRGLPK